MFRFEFTQVHHDLPPVLGLALEGRHLRAFVPPLAQLDAALFEHLPEMVERLPNCQHLDYGAQPYG